MARTFAAALLPAFLAIGLPGLARAADCTPDQADKLFHPYGEPGNPCAVDTNLPAPKEDEKPNIFADDRGPRKLYTLGVSGIEGGATIGGLGGFIWLVSEFLESGQPGSTGARTKQIANVAGLTIAAIGGALFLTGGVMLIADYATAPPLPALTPDGKGAQLTWSFRW
ncbi:MAG TPA: hypothetical protein VGK67_13255 [Myxococcales bacterium]|jgi:hypothetical protein